jgi:hypothetical protein
VLQLLVFGQTAPLRGHHIALVAVEVLLALVRGSHVFLQPPRGGGHEGAVSTGDGSLAVVHLYNAV